MKILGIMETALYVRNLDASQRFYEQVSRKRFARRDACMHFPFLADRSCCCSNKEHRNSRKRLPAESFRRTTDEADCTSRSKSRATISMHGAQS
jgi:hypothetical protein